MYCFQIGEFVVVGRYANTEEEAGVAAVDDAGMGAELDEVGLVFLVAWGDQTVDLGEVSEW